MLFMVHIKVKLPSELDAKKIASIVEEETARGMKLIHDGKALRVWRVVGEMANFSIWQSDTLEELHQNIQSLPLYRYMDVDVTPIIKHPTTEAYEKNFGDLPKI